MPAAKTRGAPLVSPTGTATYRRSMLLILDLRQDAERRLRGTVRPVETDAERPFDGIIELVGILEGCLAEAVSEKDSSGSAPRDSAEPT